MMQNVVIDVSHFNGAHLDFVKAKAAGIKAVFIKCTQSTRYTDPLYIENRRKAVDAGLYVGSYHFGSGSASGKDQADYFLHTAINGTLLALDFEPNPKNVTMGINQALEFCAHVEEATKTPIVIYTGAPMLPSATKLQISTINGLVRPLWFAQYSSSPSHAPKGWPLTLWQWTDNGFTDGIGWCDRSEFYGDDAALEGLFKPNPFSDVSGGAEGGVDA